MCVWGGGGGGGSTVYTLKSIHSAWNPQKLQLSVLGTTDTWLNEIHVFMSILRESQRRVNGLR